MSDLAAINSELQNQQYFFLVLCAICALFSIPNNSYTNKAK